MDGRDQRDKENNNSSHGTKIDHGISGMRKGKEIGQMEESHHLKEEEKDIEKRGDQLI